MIRALERLILFMASSPSTYNCLLYRDFSISDTAISNVYNKKVIKQTRKRTKSKRRRIELRTISFTSKLTLSLIPVYQSYCATPLQSTQHRVSSLFSIAGNALQMARQVESSGLTTHDPTERSFNAFYVQQRRHVNLNRYAERGDGSWSDACREQCDEVQNVQRNDPPRHMGNKQSQSFLTQSKRTLIQSIVLLEEFHSCVDHLDRGRGFQTHVAHRWIHAIQILRLHSSLCLHETHNRGKTHMTNQTSCRSHKSWL